MDESTEATVKTFDFNFNGTTREYFGIWIVNLSLSILTLGIYSAWAKVRTNRYFYGNTTVAGSSFNYTASPVKILIGRIIAVAMLLSYQLTVLFYPEQSVFLLITFLLFVPLIYISSLAFKMRYSQWRNINFSFKRDKLRAYLLFLPMLVYLAVAFGGPYLFGATVEEIATSEETGEMSDALSAYFTYGTAMLLGGMILFPAWQCFYYRFVGNRTSLGASRFRITLKIGSFYAIYLALLGMVFLSGVFMFVAVTMFSESLSNGDEINLVSFTILNVFIVAFYLSMFAFIKTAITNLIYSNIQLPDANFSSTLSFPGMVKLYLTNTAAILLSLGMAIPWAKIRLAKYRAANMFMEAEQEPSIVRAEGDDIDASADAMTDLFDLDIGL